MTDREHRIDSGSPEERVSVPKSLLERICGMVYATRGEQRDQNYINRLEYARLVSLRHGGYGTIETVLKALTPAKEGTK